MSDFEDVEVTDFYGLFKERWNNTISPASYSHPAKYNRGLIRKIYEHALKEGLVKPGDRVIDPFGGVALGGFHAALNGLHWVGIELEEHFWKLGQENIEYWQKNYGRLMKGNVTLLQGDSRNLLKVIGDSYDLSVSSPPYIDSAKPETPEQTERKKKRVALSKSMDDGRKLGNGSIGDGAMGGRYGNTSGQLGNLKEGSFDLAVSSPPYADIPQSGGTKGLIEHGTGLTRGERFFSEYGESEGQLGRMKNEGFDAAISSPPYAEGLGHKSDKAREREVNIKKGLSSLAGGNYGDTDGQLGALKDQGFDVAISSPPYADSVNQADRTNDTESRYERISESGIDITNYGGPNSVLRKPQSYGNTEGQLGTMKDQGFDMSVSSPPYSDSIGHPSIGSANKDDWGNDGRDIVSRRNLSAKYGDESGQVGHQSGQTFWTASRQIVDQVYASLKPGGIAVWNLKDYVKAGKIVPLGERWVRLCEAAGFRLIHVHRAWLVETNRGQVDLFGNITEKKVQRKSFFRLLAESKGSPEINWEWIFCMVKE